jgi:ribosomal protein L11 methyltransferase
VTHQARIEVPEEAAMRLADALEAALDPSPVAVGLFERGHDRFEVFAHYEAAPRREALLTLIAEAAGGAGIGPLEIEALPPADWVSLSQGKRGKVAAGRFIVHGSHDRGQARHRLLAIEIDAGQAFGTGHHGTTAGCLEVIDQVLRARRVGNALDLGTGSGVLAIAVRKLRNIPVLATDIDPIAVRVAAENVRRNGIASGVRTVTAPGFHSTAFSEYGPFDLIIANILARPLIRMAPKLVANLASGGSVILSGILAEQRWKVLAAYNGANLRHVRTIWRNGWVTIHLDRP